MTEQASNQPQPLKIIIDENARVVDITYEQLRATRTFADAYGLMPAQFPIEHHLFIEKIIKMLEDKGYDVICFAADVGQREDWAALKKKALKSGGSK